MTDIKGYLIESDGRSLFIRDKESIGWAIDDNRYEVTALVPQQSIVQTNVTEMTQRLSLMEEIFDLEESQIKQMKEQLADFVEAVEAIHEFSSKVTGNTLELRGLMKLIAETCGNLLKARQE